jgi:DNA-binding XRE family transcriptional regulator
MKRTKIKLLEKNGWKVGGVKEFLNLSPDEEEFIEMKLALSRSLQERRLKKNMTQAELADLLESSQSRVAKMEAGDPSVSFDLLVKSLLMLGSSRQAIARVLGKSESAAI